MTVRVLSISLEQPEIDKDRYTVVVEKPDGTRLDCTVEAFKPKGGAHPALTAFDATRETYLALLEYQAPPPPPGQSGGALLIPVLHRIVNLVAKFSCGEPIEFPVELSTEVDGV